jgi:hypothetical protein
LGLDFDWYRTKLSFVLGNQLVATRDLQLVQQRGIHERR